MCYSVVSADCVLQCFLVLYCVVLCSYTWTSLFTCMTVLVLKSSVLYCAIVLFIVVYCVVYCNTLCGIVLCDIPILYCVVILLHGLVFSCVWCGHCGV